jgi:hypothetical protein
MPKMQLDYILSAKMYVLFTDIGSGLRAVSCAGLISRFFTYVWQGWGQENHIF